MLIKKLDIVQGSTFELVVRWETTPIIYKAIQGIMQSAPVSLEVLDHGLVSGWRAAVVSVQGMTEINAYLDSKGQVKEASYHPVTVVDADTLLINEINSSEYTPYLSGGYLQYYTPVNLAGYTARAEIKDKVGGSLLHTMTTEDGGIVIDNALKTITLKISATDTAAFAWVRGRYDLELISPDATPVVTKLMAGAITVIKEVTV